MSGRGMVVAKPAAAIAIYYGERIVGVGKHRMIKPNAPCCTAAHPDAH